MGDRGGGGEVVRCGGGGREETGNGGGCGRPALGPASARPKLLLDLRAAGGSPRPPHPRVPLRVPRAPARARKAAIGGLQLWPRSSRRVASPALVGKAADAGCSHGVITPGVRSPACVWVVLRREAARGATSGVEAGRRLPSSGCLCRSSLASPRRAAGLLSWLLKEDLGLESDLARQWSWIRGEGW